MTEDPKFDLFPAGRSDFPRKRTRQLTVDFLCEATGGPCYYFRLDIKTARAWDHRTAVEREYKVLGRGGGSTHSSSALEKRVSKSGHSLQRERD